MSKLDLPADAADLSLPSLAHILKATSHVTGLSKLEITAPRRQLAKLNARVRARMFATYVARVTSKRSWAMIARTLNRDHATLIHAHEMCCALIRRNDAEVITATTEIARLAWQLHSEQMDSVRASA